MNEAELVLKLGAQTSGKLDGNVVEARATYLLVVYIHCALNRRVTVLRVLQVI